MIPARRRWALWLVAVLGTFAAFEFPALAQGREPDTLSAALRAWLGIAPERRGHRLLGIAFVAGIGWFVSHILDPDGATPSAANIEGVLDSEGQRT